MKLVNSDNTQTVNFRVYKHTDTSRILSLFDQDIQYGNNHIINGLDSSIKYDILTTPRGICPEAIVTTENESSDATITTSSNQNHITNSSIFIAIT